MLKSVPPSTMRAVLLRGHGGFEQLDCRDDVPVPFPAPGEVLIAVAAAAVNNTDINVRVGWYADSVQAADRGNGDGEAGWNGAAAVFPRIQGADACGHIVAVGKGVDPARIGERVLVDPIIRGGGAAGQQVTGYFGSECDGAFAEYTVVPMAQARTVNSDWSDEELASLPCSYIAAENMLERAAVGDGEQVLVTGASGGVGSAAVQLARRRGAQVIAIAEAGKAASVAALGALRVLPRDADLVAELGTMSIDAVIDVVGGAAFASLLQVLRPGGRYATAGAVAGPLVELDLRVMYLKDLRLYGCTVPDPELFGRLIGYVERNEFRPLVARVFPLAEIAAAQQAFLARHHTGKIVLRVAA